MTKRKMEEHLPEAGWCLRRRVEEIQKSYQKKTRKDQKYLKNEHQPLSFFYEQRPQNITMLKWVTGISERKKALNLHDQGFQLEKKVP